MLRKLGIVKSKTKGYNIFMDHIAPDFLENKMGPAEYVQHCWKKYTESGVEQNNSLNGIIFELIIATLLVKENILPLHLQAEVAFVPNAKFDAVLYAEGRGPIGLSLKTSLRERYKQADLEAVALKYVHRKAENYLLTMDPNEAVAVSEKIKKGDALGLNEAILATAKEFDTFIEELKKNTYTTPEAVKVIEASSITTKAVVEEGKKKKIK